FDPGVDKVATTALNRATINRKSQVFHAAASRAGQLKAARGSWGATGRIGTRFSPQVRRQAAAIAPSERLQPGFALGGAVAVQQAQSDLDVAVPRDSINCERPGGV